jgi:2-polyprenyl-3-methyl-5-hydroxy-6-metoxy-1,4-benzoquinol methylase
LFNGLPVNPDRSIVGRSEHFTPAEAAVAAVSDHLACPACDAIGSRVLFEATDRVFATTEKIFRIVECDQCRLIRLDPQPTPRELRDYHPTGYWMEPENTRIDRLEILYRRLVLRDHVRFVERALAECGEKGLVLDVGCGGGAFLKMLAERGRTHVAGLDFALDAARAAWLKAGVPAVCGTLSGAPFAAGSCAVVTMFHVLEHLYHPAAYLEAARELLAAGGRLIVQVPNAACWQFLLFGERWSGLEVPRGLFQFRREDLEALLDQCGFEVVRCKYFSWRDNAQGMAISLAPRLCPTGRRLRQMNESPRARFLKDMAFLALVVLCMPFTWFEAACRAGSTVTIEARRK